MLFCRSGASDRERPTVAVFSQMSSHGSNNILALHQIYNRLLSVVV